MAFKSKIEQELQKKLSIKPTSKEPRGGGGYLKRVAYAVQKLSDREWACLSDDAQSWTNSAFITLSRELYIKQQRLPKKRTKRGAKARFVYEPLRPALSLEFPDFIWCGK